MKSKKKKPVVSRRNPAQDRSRETVRAIEEATTHVLVEHGFEKTSTNKIAERAGVSIGSLYQYFPNLGSLLNHIVDREIGRHFETMARELEALRGEPAERVVTQMLEALLGLFEDNRKVRMILFQQMGKIDAASRIPQVEDRFHELLTREFSEGADPRIQVEDARVACFVVVHAALGAVRASLYEHRRVSRETLLPELRKMVLRYFGIAGA